MMKTHRLHKHKTHKRACLVAAAVAAMIAPGTSAKAAEVQLTVLSALIKASTPVQYFLELYLKKVNAAGKGVVQLRYMGGPEVTPPSKAGAALSRGVFDILDSPSSYYVGKVPEGYAFLGSNQTPWQLRKNGGFDEANKIWAKKLNARIIGWGNSGTTFHLYTTVPPIRTADGGVRLKGIKLRTSSTYIAAIEALGGTPVSMKGSETYTALQRGVVQGFGWTNIGLQRFGLHKLVKYRIDPNFYHNNILTIMNLDKWKSLSRKAKGVLTDVMKGYEKESVRILKELARKDQKEYEENGMQVVEMTGGPRKKYLKAAYDGLWSRIDKVVPKSETEALRARFYVE